MPSKDKIPTWHFPHYQIPMHLHPERAREEIKKGEKDNLSTFEKFLYMGITADVVHRSEPQEVDNIEFDHIC